jgi:hypothetical protein
MGILGIILLVISQLLLLPLATLGAFLVITWLKPKDKFTNRVSHMRLLWLAMAYPSEFDDLYRKDEYGNYEEAYEWLVKDVHENFGDKE